MTKLTGALFTDMISLFWFYVWLEFLGWVLFVCVFGFFVVLFIWLLFRVFFLGLLVWFVVWFFGVFVLLLLLSFVVVVS